MELRRVHDHVGRDVQTNRFRAAVSGAGLANWQSYYGENKIDKWMVPYFGASVYDDPAVYAKSSPITFIKNAKTPTLILVGDSDGECPPPRSRTNFGTRWKTLGVESCAVCDLRSRGAPLREAGTYAGSRRASHGLV